MWKKGGEQVRGKDSGPSTRGRKDKSRDAISSLEGRFVRLELGVVDTKEGMDLLEQSMEKRCPSGVQKMTSTRMGEKRCPVVLPGMGRARCPTLGKIKASASNESLRQS